MRLTPLLLPLLLAVPAAVPAQTTGATRERVPVPLGTAAPRPPQQPQATMVVEPVALAIAACDRDGDGVVTRAELTPCIQQGFARIADGAPSIGYIGYADWARRYLGDANALPSPFSVDADADNRITAAELQGFLAETFARLDTDHDGQLTRAETLTIRSGASGFGLPGRRGRRGGGEGGAPPGGTPPQ